MTSTPEGSESPESSEPPEGVQPPAEPTQPPPSPTQPPSSPAEPPPETPQYPPPPPLPPEGYRYGEYGAPPARPNNNMGVAALVLGIVGFLVGPASILAIIFGRIGLNRAARGEATNRGVAQAGFVLGIVTLALWILGLILLASQR